MKLNKRALLVEGIIIYEIILNYVLLPIVPYEGVTSPIIKVLGNTIVFGVFSIFDALVFVFLIYILIYELMKWINEERI